jgi:hypothetical protein
VQGENPQNAFKQTQRFGYNFLFHHQLLQRHRAVANVYPTCVLAYGLISVNEELFIWLSHLELSVYVAVRLLQLLLQLL